MISSEAIISVIQIKRILFVGYYYFFLSLIRGGSFVFVNVSK